MKSRRPERGGKTACTQGVAVEMKRQNKFKSYSRLLCLATVWLWDRKGGRQDDSDCQPA